jgi:glycogen phosphorylase
MNPTKKSKKRTKNKTNSINELKRAIAYNLFYPQGMTPQTASMNDYYHAVANTVRDRMQHIFINSVETIFKTKVKVVSYLSAEFLMACCLADCPNYFKTSTESG